MHITRTIAALAGSALLSLSAVPPAQPATSTTSPGYLSATVGATCTSNDAAWGGIYLHDVELASSIMDARDELAFSTMIEERRVIYMKAQLTLHVIQRLETRPRIMIQVRPQGSTLTVWMPTYGVDCPVKTAVAKRK